MRDTTAMALRGGIDLGGTKIQAAVVGARNGVRGQARVPTPKDGGPDGVLQAMADAIRSAAAQAKVQTSDLDGVGIGSPGEVDSDAGTVTNAYNVVPDWNRTVKVAEHPPEGARHADRARKRRPGGDDGRVRARRGQAVLEPARRVLGHRRRAAA